MPSRTSGSAAGLKQRSEQSQTNHPAPRSGLGLECDKLSRAALDTHWAGMMGPLVQGAGPLAGQPAPVANIGVIVV